MAAVIILAGTIRVEQGRKAAALPHLHAIVQASRAEPGCLSYSFAFDVLDDHLVHIFEMFENEAALAAHRASPHMAAWRAVWADVGIGERRMAQYDVSDWRGI